MSENDELTSIPPMVPERDHMDSHRSNRRAQGQEIVQPGYHSGKLRVSTWPVRIMLGLLMLAVAAGGYGAYYFYGVYQDDLRQANLRISDLEVRLALAGESAEATDNNRMENINETIEQYDLLWANWRANNQQFDDIQGELARLKLANEGQDETTATNSQAIAAASQSRMANETRINSLNNELSRLSQSISTINTGMEELYGMRDDLESIRAALSSGDSTVLGLLGRIEYIEESMESVNAHRLQINESLFRLQENLQALQRAAGTPPGDPPDINLD